jgi:hypothetical protein
VLVNRRFIVVVLGAFLWACGGDLAQPEGLVTGPTDGSVDVSPRVDAATIHIDGGLADATAGDAPDAGDAAPDDSDPSAHCSGSTRDVFYLAFGGAQGPLATGAQTYTNLDATWYAYASPGELNFFVETGAGPGSSFQIWVPNAAPLAPGTYPQGSNTGPSLDIADYDEGCTITSGTLTVDDIASSWPDGGTLSGNVSSLVMSFDVVCGGDQVRGCVRYTGDGPYPPGDDGGTTHGSPFDGGSSADLLSLCAAASKAIYVAGTEGTGVNGLVGVTGATGTWSAGLTSGSLLQLKAETPEEWNVTAESDPTSGTGLASGTTYTTSGGGGPFLQVEVQGVAVCPSSAPSGTFRLEELTYPGSDQASVQKMLLSFDMTCPDGGSVVGCASYGN